MKITDYKDLIRHMPYQEQAFEINKSWTFESQKERISKIFGSEKSIMISRNDLFHSTDDLELFIIKVLMWGYPTQGRGKNIETLLEPENLTLTIKKLKELNYKRDISNSDVKDLFSEGMRLSTISKFLYFLKIKIESYPALILDLRVISAITRKDGFNDHQLKELKTLNYNNAPENYPKYLKAIDNLATEIKVEPDQIEMFLYEFGMNLKTHVL
jgi:hypothetical protein